MFQIAATVWNQLAREQPLQTPMVREFAKLDQTKLGEALDCQYEGMTAAGIDHGVALAFQVVGPLLWENAAIQAFVVLHPNYRAVFPEVLNASEAVALATMEYRLDIDQQKALGELLKASPTAIIGADVGPQVASRAETASCTNWNEVLERCLTGFDGDRFIQLAYDQLQNDLQRGKFNTDRAAEVCTIAVERAIMAEFSGTTGAQLVQTMRRADATTEEGRRLANLFIQETGATDQRPTRKGLWAMIVGK